MQPMDIPALEWSDALSLDLSQMDDTHREFVDLLAVVRQAPDDTLLQVWQALIDHTQQTVNGWVRIKLYKGNVIVVARDSKTDSLFDPTIATFEDDQGAYNQKDAHGFIRLNALRMRIAANAKAKRG